MDGKWVNADHTFKTKTDASAWLALQQSNIKRGEWVDPDRGNQLFSEYATEWLEKRKLKPRTRESYQDSLRLHLLPAFGHLALSEIGIEEVRTWYGKLANRYKSAGDDNYRKLRAILNTAVADGLIVRSPCKIQGAGNAESPIRPVITIAEAKRIIDDCTPEAYRGPFVLAAWCALRRAELMGLQRRHVDLATGTIRVTDAKTDAGWRTVAIPSAVLPYIQAHMEKFVAPEPNAAVITVVTRSFGRQWERTRQAAGHPELHLHDLRHSGLTWLADTGASIKQLMYRGGHASPRAALRYQHASPAKDRELAESLSAATQR
jgi:integrase